VTQPIPPDRATATVSDRERAQAARPDAARKAPGTERAPGSTASLAPQDTAHVAQGSALLRAATPRDARPEPMNGAQAAAKAAQIAALLGAEPARAMQAYAGISREDVQALLATV
jgi:hypothetical protein